MFEKKKRIIDSDLIKIVKTLPCVACRIEPCGDAHHVTTVGAGGDDVATNLMPLCRNHHQEWHKVGPGKMIENYRGVKTWLVLAEREDVFQRVSLFRAGTMSEAEPEYQGEIEGVDQEAREFIRQARKSVVMCWDGFKSNAGHRMILR